ncbi:hypothetical protein PHJA_002114000 [Phtheirospermum japonicum]|uniref:Uncharacterized protein n=1 Tax=Phtheirospermum japonicum TaxID=374723 RepID=A0A830CL32_9LAMI|nr:hypothetical protein PHJA_002114000 [Phtheirospermum japonicum]
MLFYYYARLAKMVVALSSATRAIDTQIVSTNFVNHHHHHHNLNNLSSSAHSVEDRSPVGTL